MGCFARVGCAALLVVLAVAGWLTRDRWLSKLTRTTTTASSAPAADKVWQPLNPAAGQRGKRAIDQLSNPRGPVFTNLTAAEVGSYVVQAVGKSFPSQADSVEAAVIGDMLVVRAVVPMKEIAGSGVLGPLAGLLNERERISLGGTLHVIRPGLSEFRIREAKLRDFKVPGGAIPRLVQQIKKGRAVPGVADDALPVATPKTLGDVRIADGKVTLYRVTGTQP